jgi:hypothetical protein
MSDLDKLIQKLNKDKVVETPQTVDFKVVETPAPIQAPAPINAPVDDESDDEDDYDDEDEDNNDIDKDTVLIRPNEPIEKNNDVIVLDYVKELHQKIDDTSKSLASLKFQNEMQKKIIEQNQIKEVPHKEVPKETEKLDNTVENEVALLQNNGVFRRELIITIKELINVLTNIENGKNNN